ncbi:MAG: hydroxymethylbilane synthase [Actinomycetota bacterium]|nr:hydroxymethylbilane synthase [Actinomycetota bacterium]
MKLRIGTRRSRLALAQAHEIEELLSAERIDTEVVTITTSGDRGLPARPGDAGLKGLFVAEIVAALQAGEIDVAVHSAKDLPAGDPDGVVVGAVPERLDPRDVLIHREERWLGGVVGTSSIRRRAQFARRHPEVKVVDLRGNVDTRLSKLDADQVQGLVLAAAGLLRLDIHPPHSMALSTAEMVPAPGQGALALQVQADSEALHLLGVLDHAPSRNAFEAERALMSIIGGGCALPLGALAQPQPDGVHLRAVVVSVDGEELVRGQARESSPARAAELVAEQLLSGGAGAILAAVRNSVP